MAQEIIWHSTAATIARDTVTGVDTIIAPPKAVQREADRQSVATLLGTIQASIDEAKSTKVTAQAIIDSVAPTNVAQCWTKIKDTLQALKVTDNALIGATQGVKDLAKYVAS